MDVTEGPTTPANSLPAPGLPQGALQTAPSSSGRTVHAFNTGEHHTGEIYKSRRLEDRHDCSEHLRYRFSSNFRSVAGKSALATSWPAL